MSNVSGLGRAWGNQRLVYQAWSVIPEHGGVRDLIFSWFFFQRKYSGLDPSTAVRDFDSQADLRKQLIRRRLMELFEWDEVMLLRAHLKERHGLLLNIEPISLPVDPGAHRTGKIPTSLRVRFGLFLPDPLPGTQVRVAAYYDPGFTISSMCLKQALDTQTNQDEHGIAPGGHSGVIFSR